MSNSFAKFIRDELERHVNPYVTLRDLTAQLARSTGLDQDRIGHILNGVVTELSPEQIVSFANALGVEPQRLKSLHDSSLPAEKQAKIVDTDEMTRLIADLVSRKLNEALRPLLLRLSEAEDRMLQNARFIREPALPQAEKAAAVSTGGSVPFFTWMLDSMHGQVRVEPEAKPAPVVPSETIPAFEMLKAQLRMIDPAPKPQGVRYIEKQLGF